MDNQAPFPIRHTLPPPNEYDCDLILHIAAHKKRNLNSYLLAEKFQRRGHLVLWSNRRNFQLVDIYPNLEFKGSNLCQSTLASHRFLNDKDHFRKTLNDLQYSVASGAYFRPEEQSRALEYFIAQPCACVVKPNDGNKGKGVTIGVGTPDEFNEAWELAVALGRNSGVIVEHQFREAEEVRFMVIGGKCISAVKRLPPAVTGNGESSVIELVEEKNAIKCFNPNECHLPIILDNHRRRILARQGFTEDSVPSAGEVVQIDYKGSISNGGDTVEVSGYIHPSYRNPVEGVAALAAPTSVIGLDVMAKSFAAPAQTGNHIFLEANSGPALGGHMFPGFGKPVDVVTPIFDYCATHSQVPADAATGIIFVPRIVALQDHKAAEAMAFFLTLLNADTSQCICSSNKKQMVVRTSHKYLKNVLMRFYQRYDSDTVALFLKQKRL